MGSNHRPPDPQAAGWRFRSFPECPTRFVEIDNNPLNKGIHYFLEADTNPSVPKVERQRLAAVTFVGTKFSNRTPEGLTLLRCFFGGIGDEKVLDESDESLTQIARQELQKILGLTAAPIATTIARWPRAMA